MSLFKFIIRLLTFRLDREQLLSLNSRHFAAGLAGTWIAGVGRYWDDPGAQLLQHLGLGSVIYIFVLAIIIWLVVLPFRPTPWRYSQVLIFISLTSFPAILYAIPVERFVSLEVANSINVSFLVVVAAWRVALLLYFIRAYSRLDWLYVVVTTLLPICLIISTLTVLNLHRAVFEIMGGIRQGTAHDSSYLALIVLTIISAWAVIPLFLIYIMGIYWNAKKDKELIEDDWNEV